MNKNIIKNKNKNIKAVFLLSVLSVSISGFIVSPLYADNSNTTSFVEMKKNNYITNVDFLFDKKNKGIVEISLNKSSKYRIREKNKSNKIVVEIENSYLPEHLRRKIIVKEFDTTVNSIDTSFENDTVKLIIEVKEDSTVLVNESSDKISLIISKKEDFLNGSKYKGKPISVEFQDIEVREVLRVLANYTDFNLVTTDSVTGNITIALKDVPFDHALDVILQSKGLDKKITDNIIYIAPANELLKLEEDKLTAKNKIANLAQLESNFFQVKYAKAEEMKVIVESLISERGSIVVDKRTNTLIVNDISKNIKKIDSTINKLDIPIQQVLIEARIVVARKSKSEEIGVRWGGAYFDGKTYSGGSYDTVIDHFTSDEFINDGKTIISNTPVVDLGVANPAGTFALGIASSTSLLDIELSALEDNGDGEVIARPKIITADKKTAMIKSGVQIPYQQAAGGSTGGTSIAFKDAVMLLEATPQITPDGRIIIDLKITQDSIGEITASGPAIDTTQIETQVLVNNGETIVLGGIFQSEIIKSTSKVPLLGDIPAIGRLFTNTLEDERKTELLFFITPKIIESDIIRYE
jgi:type IV pilus assembly protein PilQ